MRRLLAATPHFHHSQGTRQCISEAESLTRVVEAMTTSPWPSAAAGERAGSAGS